MAKDEENKSKDEREEDTGERKPVYLFPENSIYDLEPIVIPENMRLGASDADNNLADWQNDSQSGKIKPTAPSKQSGQFPAPPVPPTLGQSGQYAVVKPPPPPKPRQSIAKKQFNPLKGQRHVIKPQSQKSPASQDVDPWRAQPIKRDNGEDTRALDETVASPAEISKTAEAERVEPEVADEKVSEPSQTAKADEREAATEARAQSIETDVEQETSGKEHVFEDVDGLEQLIQFESFGQSLSPEELLTNEEADVELISGLKQESLEQLIILQSFVEPVNIELLEESTVLTGLETGSRHPYEEALEEAPVGTPAEAADEERPSKSPEVQQPQSAEEPPSVEELQSFIDEEVRSKVLDKDSADAESDREELSKPVARSALPSEVQTISKAEHLSEAGTAGSEPAPEPISEPAASSPAPEPTSEPVPWPVASAQVAKPSESIASTPSGSIPTPKVVPYPWAPPARIVVPAPETKATSEAQSYLDKAAMDVAPSVEPALSSEPAPSESESTSAPPSVAAETKSLWMPEEPSDMSVSGTWGEFQVPTDVEAAQPLSFDEAPCQTDKGKSFAPVEPYSPRPNLEETGDHPVYADVSTSSNVGPSSEQAPGPSTHQAPPWADLEPPPAQPVAPPDVLSREETAVELEELDQEIEEKTDRETDKETDKELDEELKGTNSIYDLEPITLDDLRLFRREDELTDVEQSWAITSEPWSESTEQPRPQEPAAAQIEQSAQVNQFEQPAPGTQWYQSAEAAQAKHPEWAPPEQSFEPTNESDKQPATDADTSAPSAPSDLEEDNELFPEQSIYDLEPFVLPENRLHEESTTAPAPPSSPVAGSPAPPSMLLPPPTALGSPLSQRHVLDLQKFAPRVQRSPGVTAHKTDPFIGMVLVNKYEILDVMGEGGMAVVYRARLLSDNSLVAIKTLKSLEPIDLARFTQEIQTHSKLNHRNIVGFIEAITHEGQLFLVMERVKGISLQELLKVLKRLDKEDNIADILLQVLEALEYAHQHGVIHRDLKTGNIILVKEIDENMVVKLLDFGIAKTEYDSAEQQRITHAGQALGSPIYMSPEQCSGKTLTSRSDLYSLGVVAYEMVTGSPPYCKGMVVNVMSSHCNENVRPEPIMRKALTLRGVKMLNQILQKALETDPAKRWQSAGRLKAALHYWIAAIEGGTPPDELPPELLAAEAHPEIQESFEILKSLKATLEQRSIEINRHESQLHEQQSSGTEAETVGSGTVADSLDSMLKNKNGPPSPLVEARQERLKRRQAEEAKSQTRLSQSEIEQIDSIGMPSHTSHTTRAFNDPTACSSHSSAQYGPETAQAKTVLLRSKQSKDIKLPSPKSPILTIVLVFILLVVFTVCVVLYMNNNPGGNTTQPPVETAPKARQQRSSSDSNQNVE